MRLKVALGDNDFRTYECTPNVGGSTIIDQLQGKRIVVSNPLEGCIWLRDIALLSVEGLSEWLKRHIEAHYQIDNVSIVLRELS